MTGRRNLDFARCVEAGSELYRVHRTRPGSVAYCDNTDLGRFNLTTVPDGGTCYLAPEPLGAYMETVGRIRTRTTSDIDALRLSVMTLTHDAALFDLTQPQSRSAYAHVDLDLTGRIDSGPDYTDPHRLARYTYDDGYDGIYYSISHDNTHTLKGVALFGPAGPNESTDLLEHTKTGPIPQELIDEASRLFGLVVLPDLPE